jgi:alkanesulfonate monooxygenase SsuD/methylene tetrahydromethanopterin reductase-like flavin-dependent oxidoreductase (luciferase family)
VTGSIAWHHGSVTDLRQPTPRRTGFALRDPFPWPVFAGLAREAEALGYAAVFLPEIAGRDALVALGALAGETERLLLGTGIIPMKARTAMLTAMGAATVHERSSGRLVLGLGTGPAVGGALDDLRNLVGALRRSFSGEPIEVGGRVLQLSLAIDGPLPIWISALGPRAMRLAGEVADGVLLNWCSPERVAAAGAQVREGAEAAGRDPASVTIGVYVRASLGADGSAALRALQVATGEYASFPAYARQFAAIGLGDEARVAAAAHASGRPEEVPEALVRAICLAGDPAAARVRLDAFREAGADLPIVYPVAAGDDPEGSVSETLRALALGVDSRS